MKKIIIVIIGVLISISLTGCIKFETKKGDFIFNDNRISVKKGDKWGYYNQEGEKVIDFIYDLAFPFVNGIAVVKVNNYFLINTKGRRIITKGFDFLEIDPESGLIWYQENNLYGLLNNKGEKITDPIFDSYCPFASDLAVVEIDGKFGYINKKGKLTIDPQYEKAFNFKYGLALAQKNGYIGVINKQNETIVDFDYDSGSSLTSSGLLSLMRDNKYYVFDKSGRLILSELIYCEISNYYILGKQENNCYYLYDFNGRKIDGFEIDEYEHEVVHLYDNFVTLEVYNQRDDDIEAWVQVLDSSYWEVLQFSTVLDNPLKALGSFIYKQKIYYTYNDNGNFIIINENGKFETGENYLFVKHNHGLIVVQENGLYGVVDIVGNKIIDINYDSVDVFQDGIIVYVNGKYSIYNYTGDKIISEEFDGFQYIYFE